MTCLIIKLCLRGRGQSPGGGEYLILSNEGARQRAAAAAPSGIAMFSLNGSPPHEKTGRDVQCACYAAYDGITTSEIRCPGIPDRELPNDILLKHQQRLLSHPLWSKHR
jgi:hypothetical protein